MQIIRILGFMLLALGAYALLHLRIEEWRRPLDAPDPADMRAVRLHAAVAKLRRARAVRWWRAAGALLIGGLLLLVLAWSTSIRESSAGAPGARSGEPIASAPSWRASDIVRPEPPAAESTARDALGGMFWLSALLIALGGLMALTARQNSVRMAGLTSILAGAVAHGTLIGKVDKLFALDFGGLKVDLKGELKAEIRKELESMSRFRPQYLGGVEGFALGRSSLDSDGFDGDDAALAVARTELARICAAWKDQSEGRKSESLILIVGGTDRLALGGAARSRYEANTGLAQARAAALKRDLEQRCLSPLATSPGRVLLLASGPATTPDRASPEERRLGYPRDRRADVWVLSTVTPVPPGGPAR